MPLSNHPRVKLAHLPTPLAPLDRLRATLGPDAPRIWIKRDDCTGLATGGNKTRKLEFLIGEALAKGADVIVTSGAIQSNHVRQTAAAAAAVGIDCEAILVEMVGRHDAAYQRSGNFLLDGLLGARRHRVGAGEADSYCEELVARLKHEGRNPYVVPIGGSNSVGALGYLAAFNEITEQSSAMGVHFDAVVHASSSGGTQAGLVAGAVLSQSRSRVIGINVYKPDVEDVASEVVRIARETVGALGGDPGVVDGQVEVIDGYFGPAYGEPTEGMWEALTRLARTEGILLDPVYSGKGFAALIGEVRLGRFASNENLLFIHTGGAAAIPAYVDWLESQMKEVEPT